MTNSLSPRSLRPSVQNSEAQVSTTFDELILWLSYCSGRWSRSDRRYFEQKQAKAAKQRPQNIMTNSLSPRSLRPSVQNSEAQVSTTFDELILWLSYCSGRWSRSDRRYFEQKQAKAAKQRPQNIMTNSLSPRSLRPSVQNSEAQVSTTFDELILWLSYCSGRWSRSDRRYFEQKQAKAAKQRPQNIMTNSLSPRSLRPSVQNSEAQVSTTFDELILWLSYCSGRWSRSDRRYFEQKQAKAAKGTEHHE